jgi:hypothetical protein
MFERLMQGLEDAGQLDSFFPKQSSYKYATRRLQKALDAHYENRNRRSTLELNILVKGTSAKAIQNAITSLKATEGMFPSVFTETNLATGTIKVTAPTGLVKRWALESVPGVVKFDLARTRRNQ